jgi:hypothetical protein
MGQMAPSRHRSGKMVVVKDHREREPSMGNITKLVLIWQSTFFKFMRSIRQTAW